MKKFLIAASVMATAVSPTAVFAGDLSVSTSIDYVTEYVFRGVSFARGAVQPGVEVSSGGFYAGAWTSLAMGEVSSIAGDEIDFYGGYGFDLADGISGDVGATIYHFPDVPGSVFDFGDASTFEVYGGLSFDTTLAPSIYAYYDFDLEAFTLEGGVGHSLAFEDSPMSLDLGLTAGLVTADGGGDYEYGQASASLGYALSDNVSAYVGANYSLSSEDTLGFSRFTAPDGSPFAITDEDNLLWFGTGVSTSF